jgi:tRNA-uridine 2-sulfurtransferase
MATMLPPRGARIVVGMSGGVDSSVAALLLRRAGYDVHGLYMSNWEEDEDGYCSNAQDFQDARAVAAELEMPLHKVSFAREYRDRVFAYFLAEYSAGRTPNPDVLCNREIKFGVCTHHAARLGGDWFATGHYARLRHGEPRAQLLKALDSDKDQSYFLHGVPAAEFARVLFPLGELGKHDVRELAREAGLPTFDKPDSTGICFIGERPFREFLGKYLTTRPGPIVTDRGEEIGEHQGLALYTLGQRGGLHIGGQRGRSEEPWFVARKDASRNALVVVQGHDHPWLQSAALTTEPGNWLEPLPAEPFEAMAKVRYRQADQACRVWPQQDGSVRLEFATPQRAVAPGQFAVLYRGEVCLGGAVICGTEPIAELGLPAAAPVYFAADSRG